MSTVLEEKRSTDRRSQQDRRGQADRRRQSDSRWPVIEVSRSELRLALVVRRGSGPTDTVITRSLPWRKEAKLLHSEQGVQELTDAFRTLVAEEKLSGARVRIVLGRDLCVTRVTTGSAAHVRRELSDVEERSQLYLSLGPGRKAMASAVRQLDARHQLALLCVANQKTLDLLVRIAETLGIQITSIEPSLVALTRAQANTTQTNAEISLLVSVHDGGAELGICRAGQLLLDYRPGGRTGPENVATLLTQHLKRLQRYLARHHGCSNAPLHEVFLTGDSESVKRASLAFSQSGQFNVHILKPSDIQADWQFEGDPPGTEMTAALGAALVKYAPDRDHSGPNLVEHLLAQTREPIRPILLRSVLPFVAILLAALSISVLHWYETGRIKVLSDKLRELAPVQARADELRLKLARTESLLKHLKVIERKLPKPEWNQVLMRIANSMPRDVWLDRLIIENGASASLSGASYSDGGVYDFVNHLKQVPEIEDILLQSTGIGQSPAGPTTNFDVGFVLAKNDKHSESDSRND